MKIYEEKFEKLSKKKKILKNTLIDKEDLIRQKAAEINNLEAKLNRKPLFDINETRSNIFIFSFFYFMSIYWKGLEINEYKKENENLKARLVTQKWIWEIIFLIVPDTEGNTKFWEERWTIEIRAWQKIWDLPI